ncbi:MAG: glucose-1-phosphate thymidylyltransferase [Deltaproteobacteria bacterium]|jgi:bifunctional N-acetylglucosamine-1-phosphate-uridyltransferase/glucosamine-1-phosphate-acetyltransferase GlmU-like protein|nr:glucose-1-phosphate thymidylyltransferase [Deltaproteobacteria bacterium]
MTAWHEPANFFQLPADHFAFELIDRVEHVWTILDRLETFIKGRLRSNVAALRAKGHLVTRPAALVDRQTVFDVDYSFAQGRMTVSKDGAELVGAALVLPGAFLADEAIELAPGSLVEPGAMIKGPSYIGPGTEVRQGAYVRGSVLASADCVIGHATEAKNLLLLDGAKAGHFAYLGDSLLGQGVNLGAGTKLANLKMVDAPYRYVVDGRMMLVERRKFGAIMGDGVETGCNSVTSPGVLMAPKCKLLPNVTARSAYYAPNSILRGH